MTSGSDTKIQPTFNQKVGHYLVNSDLWLEDVVFAVTKKHILDFPEADQLTIIKDCSKLYCSFVFEHVKSKYGLEEALEIELIKYKFISPPQKHSINSKLWEANLAFQRFLLAN